MDTITITTTPNAGWQCPACMKCYAPHVGECRTCGKDESEQEADPGIGIPDFNEYNGGGLNNPLQGSWTFEIVPPISIPSVFSTPNSDLPNFTVTCSSPPSLQDLECFDAGHSIV